MIADLQHYVVNAAMRCQSENMKWAVVAAVLALLVLWVADRIDWGK